MLFRSGTELNLGNAVGKNGADGVSISGAAVNESGELVLSFSNNKTVNVSKVVGATGIKGDKGEKGDTGWTNVNKLDSKKGKLKKR